MLFGLGCGVTLGVLDVLAVNRCERVLSTCNARGCPLDVVASDGEKACRVVQFDAPTAVPPVGEFAGDQDVIASAGWRYLRVRVESPDDV